MGSRGGREGSHRVRQIPIQVENHQEVGPTSRFYRQPQQQQQNNPLYNTMPSNYEPTNQSIEGSHPNERFTSQNHESPDSRTSININYRPTPPVRQDQQQQNLGRQQQYQQQQEGTRSSSMNRDVGGGVPHDRSNYPRRPHSHMGNHQQPHAEQEHSRSQPQQSETFNTQQGNLNFGNTESQSFKAATAKRKVPIPMPLPPDQADIETASGNQSGENQSSTETEKQQQTNIKPQQKQSSNQSQAEPKADNSTTQIQVQLDNVRQGVAIYFQQIIHFSGKDAQSKDARYLEEMLSRYELALDKIQCGSSTELRQQRKAIILLIEKGIDILERKIKLNADIQELTQGMDSQLAEQLQQLDLDKSRK